jgi:IS30 family transposase
MSRLSRSEARLKRDEALLRAVLLHEVPIRTIAAALGITRQTVYRRMQYARKVLRRIAQRAELEATKNPQILVTVKQQVHRRCRREKNPPVVTTVETAELVAGSEQQ